MPVEERARTGLPQHVIHQSPDHVEPSFYQFGVSDPPRGPSAVLILAQKKQKNRTQTDERLDRSWKWSGTYSGKTEGPALSTKYGGLTITQLSISLWIRSVQSIRTDNQPADGNNIVPHLPCRWLSVWVDSESLMHPLPSSSVRHSHSSLLPRSWGSGTNSTR